MDKKKLIFDVVLLVVYLIVANPAFTGIGFHEWLGLGVFVAFIAHVAINGDWIASAMRSVFSNPSWARTGNFVIDLLILLAFMLCTVSGIMVSGAVLPALGLYVPGYFFWDPLHAVSAKALLALLLIHVVVHWKWFSRVLGKTRLHEINGKSEDNNHAK